jgi:glycerol-3-phosphate cytidylyltransferase
MKKNIKVGFTCSAFDLLHAGHVIMLKEAKSLCDHLIVGLQNDPSFDRKDKNKPAQSLVERFIQLSAVKYVDEIFVYNTEEDLMDLLQILPINIRILGDEYLNRDFTGRQYCLDKHIELYFNNRDHRFSSSELRKRIKDKHDEII